MSQLEDRKLYMYISGGNTAISTDYPIWNVSEGTYWHKQGARVLTVDGIKTFISIAGEEDPKLVLILSKNGIYNKYSLSVNYNKDGSLIESVYLDGSEVKFNFSDGFTLDLRKFKRRR